jgi:hypothetical protein
LNMILASDRLYLSSSASLIQRRNWSTASIVLNDIRKTLVRVLSNMLVVI